MTFLLVSMMPKWVDGGAIFWESRKVFGEKTNDGLKCRGVHGTSKQRDVQWLPGSSLGW